MLELGQPRFEFDTVTSTNDFAKEGIAKGVPEGALYTAKHQTKGRGRRGASWSDAPGESALMSFVLYPPFPLEDIWMLSFAAALAVSEALRALGTKTAIKWPNDIILGGGKLAGVLVEAVGARGRAYAAIIGIGINVAQKGFPEAEGYALSPVSLRMATGDSRVSISQVIDEVARHLSRRYADCSQAEDRQRMLRLWHEHLVIGELQRGVCVETGRKVRGFLRDVRLTDGAALLEEQDGTFTVARPIETTGEGPDGV
jgi:BirA family biotin operon repressor/biotin-[acetyl-CoA-carboxylase] ligase